MCCSVLLTEDACLFWPLPQRVLGWACCTAGALASPASLLSAMQVVAGSCSEVVVEVPLHARYPHPQDPRQQLRQQSGGNSGWAAAALSAAATAELPPPRVLVRCPGDEQGDGGWQAADIDGTGRGAAAGVWWDMPAGNVRHGPLVAAGTTAAMACGATAVLLVLCRSQTAVWRKQQ